MKVRLQRDVQFIKNIKLHLGKKKLEKKPNTHARNTCVLMGDSNLNRVIERNLSNDQSVKGALSD